MVKKIGGRYVLMKKLIIAGLLTTVFMLSQFVVNDVYAYNTFESYGQHEISPMDNDIPRPFD